MVPATPTTIPSKSRVENFGRLRREVPPAVGSSFAGSAFSRLRSTSASVRLSSGMRLRYPCRAVANRRLGAAAGFRTPEWG